MRIACLHTIGANVAVFDAAAAPLGLTVEHAVRDDLLKSAEAAGGTTPEIDRRTADALLELVRRCGARRARARGGRPRSPPPAPW